MAVVALLVAAALAFPTGGYARNVTTADLVRQHNEHGMCKYCDPPATGTWRMTVRVGRMTLRGPDGSIAYERFAATAQRL